MHGDPKSDAEGGVDTDLAGVQEAVFGDHGKVWTGTHDSKEMDDSDGEELGEEHGEDDSIFLRQKSSTSTLVLS